MCGMWRLYPRIMPAASGIDEMVRYLLLHIFTMKETFTFGGGGEGEVVRGKL